MSRFVNFYWNKNDPEAIREVVAAHEKYWVDLALPDYMGGPFADRTGGMTIFSAPDHDRAEEIVRGDPFHLHGLIEKQHVKEWILK